MREIGVVCIILSSSIVGIRISGSLKHRCLLLQNLIRLLRQMEHEIELYGTPVPQLFALMAASAAGELEQIFSAAAHEMDRDHWITPYQAMEEALNDTSSKILSSILLPLCRQLGRYDRDAQLTGITASIQEAEVALHAMEKERSIKSKTYQTLGICTGLAASVLLL